MALGRLGRSAAAGDDEDQPGTVRLRFGEEAAEALMRGALGQPVQVEAGVDLEPAARELCARAPVERTGGALRCAAGAIFFG